MAVVASIRRQVQLCIGKAGLPVGSLVYVRQGRRENSAFAYDEDWLASTARFNVSVDPRLPALTELDYLLAVDDFSRVGALRLRDPNGTWQRTTLGGLGYLQGRDTSLSGMWPKYPQID